MQQQYGSDTEIKKRIVCASIILLCFFCAAVIALVFPVPVSVLEHQKNDMLFRMRYRLCGKQKISPYLVHVVLDDASIKDRGLPLWDRTVYGRIIRLLSGAGAVAIVCDVFFQFESTPENDAEVIAAASESGGVYFPVIVAPRGYPAFPHAADVGTENDEGIVWHPAVLLDGRLPESGGIGYPFQALAAEAAGLGHINCSPDSDGVNRRFPLLIASGGGVVPSLTLRAVADFLDVSPADIEVVAGSHILLKGVKYPGRRERDVTIPVDGRGRIILNHVGPWDDSFIPFPVEKILDAERDEEVATHLYNVMHDAFVVLSNVSTGNKDYGASTFDNVYPLSGIHLNVANMILTENFIDEATLLENVITGCVLIVLLWIFSYGRRSRWYIPSGLIIMFLFFLYSAGLFLFLKRLGVFVPHAIGIILSLAGVGTYLYATEEKEKSFFRGRFESEKENILYKNRLILSLSGSIRAPLERMTQHVKTLSGKEVVRRLPSLRDALCGIEQSCAAMTDLFSELLDLTKYRKVHEPALSGNRIVTGEGRGKHGSEDTNVCLLIVDDNEYERTRIRELCEGTYRVLEAENGKNALQVFESEKVDLVISDLLMPEMNGDDLIAELKKGEETAAIPVILLTGLAGEEIEEEPDDILSKQFTDRELLKSVENALERSSQKKQLVSYRNNLVLTGIHHEEIVAEKNRLYPENPVVIVEDEKEILQSYRRALCAKGINNVRFFSKTEQLLPFLLGQPVSILILDTSIPGGSGDAVLLDIRKRFPDIPVVMASGIMEMETAVRCIGAGAYDYLVKPVETEKLASLINHCIELRFYRETLEHMSSKLKHPEITDTGAFSHIITCNERLLSLFRYCEAVSGSPKPFLIVGESGVGKELFAEAIHLSSGRKGRFVCENIGGLDDTMISDTLFGHEKGAFTGAENRRKGLLEEACGGTLFLDEVGDIPLHIQVKLLRLLEKNEYRPIGSDSLRRADVRIIGATNRDIAGMAKRGEFRQDLLSRFVHTITIPPLRERWDDLPLLVNHFIKTYGGGKTLFIPDELYGYLKIYDFPGNVRELQTLMVNALRLNKGNILSLDSIKSYIREKRNGEVRPEPGDAYTEENLIFKDGPAFPTLKQVEAVLIDKALKKADGMQTVASQLLGISPSNLSKKLKKLKKRTG
ncbi:MAG: sigma 54-interacting transcriptional regulator [Spirochaetales bacterium]|nr:sigma 54-interacting transcriptional regulator [Spirochaetales bacterium]